MIWPQTLAAQLGADRQRLERVYAGEAAPGPGAALVAQQRDAFGLPLAAARLPEHFRGPWEAAAVCFLGPHVMLVPAELAPGLDSSPAAYVAHYRERPERRDPYGHYTAIMDGAPWLATELVHWPGDKELALKLLKSPAGPALLDETLGLTWALLLESAVRVVVLTVNDALRWTLPRLGWSGGALPGVTQLHGETLGRFQLPGAGGRELTVIASVHWSKEMPLFVRKLPGLAEMTVREAVGAARRRLATAIAAALA